MQTECSPTLFEFASVEDRKVVADFGGGTMTSNAGALLLGSADRAVRLVERAAGCFIDRRDASLIEHSVATLVGQRIFGLALGHEDLVDHDALRHDPLFAVLAGKLKARRSDCAPVAGKSTLNRLERSKETPSLYHKIAYDGAAIERLLVDLFLESRKSAPDEIILDLDATDDPLHGGQEGRFFHGYYDSYCYLPLYVFCGDQLLVAKLRKADIDASAGAADEIARVIARIRARWPKVRIILRARGADGLVRSQRRRVFVRSGAELSAERRDLRRSGGRRRGERCDRRAGATVQGFQVPHAGQLEPRTSRDRQGRMDDAFPRRGRRHDAAPEEEESEESPQGQSGRRPAGDPASRTRQSALHRDVVEGRGARSARALREALLRARRDGEPHQGMSARPVRRPDILAHDARQSTAPLARFIRLRADERAAAHRPDQHAPRRRDLWHDSPEAAQDRRSGEDQFPAHPVLDGLGFSLRRRLRGGLGGAALGRLTTPRPTGDLSTK